MIPMMIGPPPGRRSGLLPGRQGLRIQPSLVVVRLHGPESGPGRDLDEVFQAHLLGFRCLRHEVVPPL